MTARSRFQSRRVWQAVFSACLLLLVLYTPLSAAQSGALEDPYKTELLDWSVSVSGPNYVLEEVSLEEYPHGRGERIYITNVDSLGFAEVAFFDDTDTPDQSLEIMLRDFESASTDFALLENGSDGNVHFALARFEIDHHLTGYFYIEIAQDVEGNIDVVQSLYSLNADFLEQIEIARGEIDLNGLAFLADPAIDLDSAIAHDEVLLDSTPDVATPVPGSFTYESGDATLNIQPPVEYDFAYSNPPLDVRFLKTPNAYAVVGYISQTADSPEAVLGTVFIDAPVGDEAPQELHIESDADRALGVYRINTEGETRLMVVEIRRVSDDLWTVQALAAEQSVFSAEFETWQQAVEFDGDPLLNEIDPADVLQLLD